MNTPSPIFHGDEMTSTSANQTYYQRHKEQEKARTTRWRKENPEWYKAYCEKNKEKLRANGRQYEYSITPEEYEQKKQEQDGKCAICRQEAELLVVDHSHSCCEPRRSRAKYKTCGKCNRGLLCRSCNTAIGLLKESEEIFLNAIQYLKRWNTNV
jgi:hypothetical protein